MAKIKLTGDNSHGFENETQLANELNNKQLKELNIHLKKFIKNICTDHDIEIKDTMLIKAYKAGTEIAPDTKRKINPKPDIYVDINGMCFGISTKMGTGNSFHQEKVESFISWIKTNDNIISKSEALYNDLRYFIWSDGTLDGTAPVVKNSDGSVIGRFATKDFKKLHLNKWEKIQNFLSKNQKEIIKRAVFLGKSNKEVHYIYHGTTINGVWISQNELINYILENPLDTSVFNVGRLSFQIYNADLKATAAGAKKRGQIQLKYTSIEKDIENLMLVKSQNISTFEGNLEEFNFSKMMNKNERHPFWEYLHSTLSLDRNKFYYVVKVEGQKFSKNAKKNVMCKSDNYLIETLNPIDKSILLAKEYQLVESDLNEISEYTIIKESGISIKQKESKSYTITKMTINNFKSAFQEYIDDIDLISTALIFYCTSKQVSKNYKIANDLKIEESTFISYFSDKYGITAKNLLDYNALSEITNLAKGIVKSTIETNDMLKKALFSGKGWFEAPYYINFLYSYGNLTNEIYTPYNIDNGSGRSKGKYYITIKPQHR